MQVEDLSEKKQIVTENASLQKVGGYLSKDFPDF
jgi:hypothetical protein